MNERAKPDSHVPPVQIQEYARSCVSYVQTALGIALDFEPETLPLLDHYLRQARTEVAQKPETLPLLAAVAGSYLGEVLRRQYPCSWVLESSDSTDWEIRFADLPLKVFPVALAREALTAEPDSEPNTIVIEEGDREIVAERLDRLPPVSDDDYLALSTRLEVVDIAVDILRSRKQTPREEN